MVVLKQILTILKQVSLFLCYVLKVMIYVVLIVFNRDKISALHFDCLGNQD